MFYITDINGVLQPYDPERFRIEREARLLASAREAERQAEYAGTPEDIHEADSARAAAELRGEGIGSVSGRDATKAPEQVATGLAGATMLHRQREGGAKGRGGRILSDDRDKFRTEQLLKHMLRPAAKLSKKAKHSAEVNPYAKLDEPLPERRKALCVRDIMSKDLITLTGDQTVDEAGNVFKSHRFRHIPIVSATDGKLIGIISDRDYLSAGDKSTPLSLHMATSVLTARPETEIRRVAEVMFEHRIGAMPVLDQEASLVGIVTRSDILCALVHGAPLELWV